MEILRKIISFHQNPDFWEGGGGVSSFSNGIYGTKGPTTKKS